MLIQGKATGQASRNCRKTSRPDKLEDDHLSFSSIRGYIIPLSVLVAFGSLLIVNASGSASQEVLLASGHVNGHRGVSKGHELEDQMQCGDGHLLTTNTDYMCDVLKNQELTRALATGLCLYGEPAQHSATSFRGNEQPTHSATSLQYQIIQCMLWSKRRLYALNHTTEASLAWHILCQVRHRVSTPAKNYQTAADDSHYIENRTNVYRPFAYNMNTFPVEINLKSSEAATSGKNVAAEPGWNGSLQDTGICSNRNTKSTEEVSFSALDTFVLSLALFASALAIQAVTRRSTCGNTALKTFDDQSKSMQSVYRSPKVVTLLHATLKLPKSLQRYMSPFGSAPFLLPLLSVATVLLTIPQMEAARDLRESILNGTAPCFHYVFEKSSFHMNCSVLRWQAQGYGSDTYISLGANEIVDGSSAGNNTESYIDLSGIIDFEGLFKIREGEVTTFSEAPLIKNVHVRDGKIASFGGFIVQTEQKYFVVDSCSSTGEISHQGGGICGARCGLQNGEIKIVSSFSTGLIKGQYSGGIAGEDVGYEGGIVHIIRCYSTGNIRNFFCGGICGDTPGNTNGQVYIKQCFSTGDITSGAWNSGGIVGSRAGFNKGYVHIQECYSTGQILGANSGGIAGSKAAENEGEVHIVDCYTRGDIDASFAGGITGLFTGGFENSGGSEEYGDVYINNTYASGSLKRSDTGGMMSVIYPPFQGHTIHVQYSVYNYTDKTRLILDDEENHVTQTGNSYDLSDIQGQLYHFDGVQRWNNDSWAVNGTDTLPILRFQLLDSVPSSSPTPTSAQTMSPTTSATVSSTPSATPTRTSTATCSNTQTPSRTATPTATTTITETPPSTASPTATSSSTGTSTATPSVTSSSTETPPSTATPTATTSSTGTPPSTATPTATSSWTETPSSTATPTTTSSRTETPSPTATPTATSSRTQTPSSSATPTATSSRTQTPSSSATPTATSSRTKTPMSTPSATKTTTVTSSSTPTIPQSPSPTSSFSASSSLSLSSPPSPPSSKTEVNAPTATLVRSLASGILSFLGIVGLILGAWYYKKRRASKSQVRSRTLVEPEAWSGVGMNSNVNPLTVTKTGNSSAVH